MKNQDTAHKMARRTARPAGSSMAAAFPTAAGTQKLVHLTIQVPEDVRRQLKTVASQEGVTVRDIVLSGIHAELESRNR